MLRPTEIPSPPRFSQDVSALLDRESTTRQSEVPFCLLAFMRRFAGFCLGFMGFFNRVFVVVLIGFL